MTTPPPSASDRRAAIQANAAAMGIDLDYISILVEEFYARIRAHDLLGPIFADAIGEDWAPHLQTMKNFWASVALNAGFYSGKPVPAHRKLLDVEPWHFNIWLALFEQTLKDTAPSQEAVPYFLERANRIAESLKLAMFGIPGLPASNTGAGAQ